MTVIQIEVDDLSCIANVYFASIADVAGVGSRDQAYFRNSIIDQSAEMITAITQKRLIESVLVVVEKAVAAGVNFLGWGSVLDSLEEMRVSTDLGQEFKDFLTILTTARWLARIEDVEFLTSNQIEEYRELLSERADICILLAADRGFDGLYIQLQNLLGACIGLLDDAQKSSAFEVSYEFNQSMPAIALSRRLYANIDRVEELYNANECIHPAFMPVSGVALSK